jgi:hypothetical protein
MNYYHLRGKVRQKEREENKKKTHQVLKLSHTLLHYSFFLQTISLSSIPLKTLHTKMMGIHLFI